MRVVPNRLRLRVVALYCFVLGAICGVYNRRIMEIDFGEPVLVAAVFVLALLLISIGLAFWLLSSDRHAEVRFDKRGLLLNLGHSSSFVAWEQIERVGTTRHRRSLWTLGSAAQLGIALRDTQPYIQSYEERLPSSRGPLGSALRKLVTALRPFRRSDDKPLITQLAHNRSKTGYDILVPEALLGTKPQAFMQLLEAYRPQLPPQRAGWNSAR